MRFRPKKNAGYAQTHLCKRNGAWIANGIEVEIQFSDSRVDLERGSELLRAKGLWERGKATRRRKGKE